MRARTHRGIVAAGHTLTAQAAAGILRQGGNAFDAAVAGFFAACVAEPVLTALGGGGFLNARAADGRHQVFDFFAQTPRESRPPESLDFRPIVADFGADQQGFHVGLGAVATPGAVAGMFAVQRELGSMPMSDLVAPAVSAARAGVRVSQFQAYLFSVVAPIYQATAGARALYASPKQPDCLPCAGQLLRNPELAEVLETLGAEGEDFFYRGDLAKTMIGQCESGGLLGAADLDGYRVVIRAPLEVDFRGHQIALNPEPSIGGLLIAFGLALVSALGPRWTDAGPAEQRLLLAQIMGASQHARLATLADSSASALLKPERLARYRAQIRGRRLSWRGTTQLSVIDAAGNVASMTTSNGEGCGAVVPGGGFMLNNMLGEEDLNPGGFHLWQPNRRLCSMMCPTLVFGPDQRQVALGSGGSNRIRTAILQVLLHLLDGRQALADAVALPRIHFENDFLSVENASAPGVGKLLESFPMHKVWDERNLFFGGVHAVASGPAGFAGVGDPRRDGVVLAA